MCVCVSVCLFVLCVTLSPLYPMLPCSTVMEVTLETIYKVSKILDLVQCEDVGLLLLT